MHREEAGSSRFFHAPEAIYDAPGQTRARQAAV